MDKVTIFRFKCYNVTTDSMDDSSRWGTRAAIEQIAKGVVIEASARVVDEMVVRSDIPGLTARDFNPDTLPVFQTSVQR
ncbi:hypothetical protein [Burkholderia glumae]|uniref:hypothetical protein n=1 Tax=Burkholderia glumae TaxID=337 RepID=UPI0021515AC3|nr:hypothetical protein [Burkholderia glumae]